ncbi:MAG: hypothetical protein MIO93_13065 [ANME-2 cluster archaeon]|nr:hypothetical protein [ANME-2 cluster archaeon]
MYNKYKSYRFKDSRRTMKPTSPKESLRCIVPGEDFKFVDHRTLPQTLEGEGSLIYPVEIEI